MQQKMAAMPPQKSEVDKQIESAEKMALAKIEQDRLIWAERIQSDERKKAAELSVTARRDQSVSGMNLGKQQVDIEKLNLDKLALDYKREDMMRKDAEILDVDTPKRRSPE
jgi:hypothetical protein